MQISASNSNFLNHSIKIEPAISSIDIENLLIDAFESSDQEKCIQLLNQGANPNQIIPLTKEIVIKLIKKEMLICDCNGPVDAKELESDETYEGYMNAFFDEVKEFPILLMALSLENEEVAIELIEKGADPRNWIIEKMGNRDESDKKINFSLYEMAEDCGCFNVCEYLKNNPEKNLKI